MKLAYATLHDYLTPRPNQFTGITPANAFLFHALTASGEKMNCRVVGLPALTAKGDLRLRVTSRLKHWFPSLSRLHKSRLQKVRQAVFDDEIARCGALDGLVIPDAGLSSLQMPEQVPFFIVTDAPVASLFDFYPETASISQEKRLAIFEAEKRFYHRAGIIFLSNQWSVARTRELFGIPTDKMKVVPQGANLPTLPDRSAVVDAIGKRSRSGLRLLYVGNNWERKGGALAVETAKVIHGKGLDVTLSLLGFCPTQERFPPFVKKEGFMDVFSGEGKERYAELLRTSHYLLLPTRADVCPYVVAEAMAWGMPALATDVGGISTVINNGVNGWMFPLHADSNAIAELVMCGFRDRTKYESMAFSAFEESQRRLTWEACSRTVLSEIIRFLS